MRPTIEALTAETFDVVVVGAGIHGVAAAWTAAGLGLRTALIDQDDFGGGASANSLKVIHGGLRYLQHGNVGRMRESILARRRFLQLAPHLVRPQPFLVPTSGFGLRSRAALRVALCLNDLVAADRNQGVAPERRLPAGRLLGRKAAREALPGLAGVTGGAVWYDALAENTERLTLSFALSAREAGAAVANYVRARGLIVEGGAVRGLEVEDVHDGGTFTIRTCAVINAAGPWMAQPWAGARPAPHPLVGAWNIVVRQQWFGAYGVGLESERDHQDAEALVRRGKRNLFFVPWRGGTMIGTVYEPFAGDPSEYRPSAESVETFLREINTVYPPAGLTRADVTFVHVGVQPGPPQGHAASVEPDKHSSVLEEAARGGPRGLLTIKGVKYTTGLSVGRRAAEWAARTIGYAPASHPAVPLYGGERWVTAADVSALALSRKLRVDERATQRLAAQYGTRAEAVLDVAKGDGAAVLPGTTDTLQAEVRYAIRSEDALRLSDVILRRTDLGTFAQPADETTLTVTEIMTRELGWSPERVRAENQALAREYERLR